MKRIETCKEEKETTSSNVFLLLKFVFVNDDDVDDSTFCVVSVVEK